MITRTSTILLEGIKDLDNRLAWQEFDRRYRPVLMAVGRRLGLSPSDAEDAAQDTLAAFIEGYRAGRYNRQAGRLRDWITGIMTHKVRDLQRRGCRQESLLPQDDTRTSRLDQIEDSSVSSAVEQEWSKAIMRQALEEVRQEASAEMFESFELFAIRQWPATQVAAKLGISLDLVYQNKRRMLQRIRQVLPKVEEIW